MKKGRRSVLLLTIFVAVLVFSSIAVSGPAMVEKNLFAQDRRPPAPETAPVKPQSNVPGLSAKAIQLDGVFIHGDTRKALIRYKGGPPPGKEKERGKPASPFTTVQEGGKIGDFVVKKIEPRSISLEKDGQIVVVNLFAEGKVVPPAPPMPSSPAAPGGDANRARGGSPPQPGAHDQAGNELPGAAPPNMGRPPVQDERAQAGQGAPAEEPTPQEEETTEEEPQTEEAPQ